MLLPTGILLDEIFEVSNEKSTSLGLCAYLELFSLTIGKQARMKSKPGSGKRQERNFENVVNHITTNEDQLPQAKPKSCASSPTPAVRLRVYAGLMR